MELGELVTTCRANLKSGRSAFSGLPDSHVRALLQRYWRLEDTRDNEGFITNSRVVVTSLNTPRPVLHMMCSNHGRRGDQWASFWDQHGGGFSCVDSVLAGRMTSHLDTNYVPTAPEGPDIRNFYIHENGQSWPMFPLAGHQEDSYEGLACGQALDEFELRATRDGLSCRLEVFVHPSMPLEVWQVSLTNTSCKTRRLSWFSSLRVNVDSFPFYYFVPRVVCEGLVEDGSLVFLNHDQNNKHPRAAFVASAEPFDGFDQMSEVFEGHPARAPIPAAVARGSCFGSLGLQPYAGLIAAVQFDAELAPDKQCKWTLAYGKCPTDKRERKAFISLARKDVLDKPDQCRKQLAETWSEKVAADMIATDWPELDRYYNIWSKYQLRNQARFVRALDKIGYRDILQDLLGVCAAEPEYVRAALSETLQYQYADGRAVRQYERFPGCGNDTRLYQDSPVWIPHLLNRYLAETGDADFLSEQVAFLDADTLQVDPGNTAGVYEHAALAVRSVFRQTGFRGLCRIGYGDWNDALSGIGGERGVSVWLSCACVHAANNMAEIAASLDRQGDREEFERIAHTMTQRINEHAWDGKWYIYAIDNNGKAIGSSECDEGKIHLNVNTWALFTGVAAAAGREKDVWQSLEQLATPVGHRLLAPSYTAASRDQVGRIADCMPGMFENGSIYTHGESFYLYALASVGKSDAWLEQVAKTLPTNQIPDISTCPPQQQSNFFVGPDHARFGENLFSNFTGAVTWYRLGIEKIVGIEPCLAGLRINPRPPSSWDKLRVRRRYRGSLLDISMRRTEADKVTLDGKRVDGIIPVEMLKPDRRHVIEVEFS